MSTWFFVAALAVMAAFGVAGLVAVTPGKGKQPEQIPDSELELTTFAAELVAIDIPAEANYQRSDEYPLIERPAGDTQEWLVQERPPQHAASDEDTVEVLPAALEVPHWMQPVLEDEPTPLFAASGEMPALVRLESHTDCWTRDGLLDRIRHDEYELAKGWRDEVQAEVAENPEYVSSYVEVDRDRGVRGWPSCAGPAPEELVPGWAKPPSGEFPRLVEPAPLQDPMVEVER